MSKNPFKDNDEIVSYSYSKEISIRGQHIALKEIKLIYRELQTLSKNKGEAILNGLTRRDDVSEDEHRLEMDHYRKNAFCVTVSIFGYDEEDPIVFGNSETVFDINNLPWPIKTIFFTNETSFKSQANGNSPDDRFSFWFQFDKPPLIDPNPMISSPTPNGSRAVINAVDVGFYRAVLGILQNRLKYSKKWYSFIHEKFSYDFGLILVMPVSMFWLTIYADRHLPIDGTLQSFRLMFFICGFALSLLCYRTFFGYLKWAFPLNTLIENKDAAHKHRFVLFGIISIIAVSIIESIFDLGISVILPL